MLGVPGCGRRVRWLSCARVRVRVRAWAKARRAEVWGGVGRCREISGGMRRRGAPRYFSMIAGSMKLLEIDSSYLG